MLDVNELNDDVIEAIANSLGLDSGEESTTKKIELLSTNEAFDRFLSWHGIIGYSGMIKKTLLNIMTAGKEK